MASGVGKHKLLSMGPTEPWSVREKLCLATSVMKSGDQNWVSVSRAIKPFAEPGRPPDWFSQKHCASQYSELLETTETPKRKRGEKGEVVETVEDVIVRRLTAERIDELKRLIKDTQEKHRKLKTEAELIQAGHLDSKLEDLWGEIVQKKKQEQDEADVKRKVTDTAYLARQAVKNTPKRVPSVTVRSPLGCGSPSLEFCQGDTPQSTPEDPSTSVTAPGVAGFMPLTEACGLGGAESGLGTVLDESPQKKLLGQKATPPPSPLLSELLKKGSLLPTSPRLVGDGDLPGNMTIAHDLQLTGSVLPGSLATGGNEVGASQPGPGDGTEEDLVTVSYMAEELDLETVGDIIAIIEDKGDENTEALDAAAVEAALSLCEETGHALSGHWEPGPFKSPESDPSGASHLSSLAGSLEVKREVLQLRRGTSACDSQDNCPSGYPHPLGISGLPPSSSSSSCSSMMLEHSQAIGARLQPGAMGGADGEGSPFSPHATIRCESEEWTQQGADTPHADSEDCPMTRRHSKDVKEEEGVSDGEEGSASETKEGLDGDGGDEGGDEEGDGAEAYLSEAEGETELEPPASESEDGYSLHTASSSLQLHTTADSIPSSPASSQFSMCSEDQEARQAQKIWKKAIMLVWRAAANHRYANVFLQPVTDDIAPGYHSIVHRPMDLSTIKKNIETGLIRTTAEFQRDIMLMFQNAVMYNSCDHDVFHMALEMQRDVLEQIQQFLATQLIMQTSESGVSAKSLRGRESTRKQDPSDKDSVPMASPAFLLSLFVSTRSAVYDLQDYSWGIHILQFMTCQTTAGVFTFCSL
ncbi:bromodomain-containing protein 8 isoform X4 [Salmo salar]|uniref:Bromodomain-containing protein 8 n=1 Tax=Salmo salar TaxID=8030 RepID=A0A1S3L1R0_SALSA|nr:bromodomain-containing protein 8 isoform X4 [Salmo salar]|eukprot:XP_013984848.1 PREDICTED: bromodomain-containing protein 8 isoform X5 [Salmo salar]